MYRYLITALFAGTLASGEDVAFHKSKIVDQGEFQADLTFRTENRAVVAQVKHSVIAVVPYDSIGRVVYLMEKQQLEIHYEKVGIPLVLTINPHKSEYQAIVDTIKLSTSLDVEIVKRRKDQKTK